MKRFRGKNLAVAMVFALLFTVIVPNGLVTIFADGSPGDSGVTVTGTVYRYEEGNPKCDDSFKIDNINGTFNGTYDAFYGDTNQNQYVAPSGKNVHGSITISNSTNYTFDWEASSNIQVNKVIVKASNGAYIYEYNEFTSSDSGLFSPKTDGNTGNQADISHVTFCYTVTPEVELHEDSLNLTSICIDEDLADTQTRWRITNDSGVDVDFTYEVYGTNIGGSGTIPAAHTTAERFNDPFYLNVNAPHPATLIIRWGDDKEFSVTKASSGDICEVEITGILTVEKVLLDEQGEPILEDDTEFTIQIVGSNDHLGEYDFSVNKSLEFTVDDIGLGTFYFYEIDIPEGYEFDSIDPGEEGIEFDGSDDVTVTITNKVETTSEDTGTLTIEKILYYPPELLITEDDTEFTVNISNDNGYNEDHTFSVDDPLVLSGLELGTYTVTEIDVPEGYAFESIIPSNGEVELTEEENEVTVWVYNSAELPTGTLTVEKVLYAYHESEGLDEDFIIAEDDTEFTVNITGPEGYDEEYTFSVNESLVLNELLLGDYTVEEINIPEGYTFEFMDPSNGELSFTLNENEVIVTIANMLEEDDGSIDDGDDPIDDDDDDDVVDDDDDDDPIVDDDDDAIDEDDDDDVTIQVDPDPTPLAPPIIEIEPEIMEIQVEPVPLGEPVEEEEEVIILDEEVPLAAPELPQTGERNPIGFYLLGILLTAIGVKLKKVF